MNFEFNVNKENKTIHVVREFDADKSLVWKAWTTAELLDQWWAPLPYKNVTKSLDFRESGTWLYSMVSPEGDVHWCLFDYHSVDPENSYSGEDAFCDESGKIADTMPRSNWQNQFNESNGRTTVSINITLESLEQLEQMIAMGFKEGFTAGLNQLEELLATIKNG